MSKYLNQSKLTQLLYLNLFVKLNLWDSKRHIPLNKIYNQLAFVLEIRFAQTIRKTSLTLT